ncbi:MAG: putative acetyltransferase [Ilumatobacteraceae bacterium]|nr:putative acetyltransferase [Ilumatobacteraceae bacterium]
MSLLSDRLPAPPLELRRWSDADLPDLMSAIELSVEELGLWLPWAAEGVPSVDEERSVLAAGVVDFDQDVDWSYSLFESSSGELVGGCGLHRRSTDCLEIGYWVRSDRHRRGYATAAARCLTNAAFACVTDAVRVEIRMDRANVASARVPAKLGYQLDGDEAHELLARGHTGRRLIWSTTRDRWSAVRIESNDREPPKYLS